MIEKLPFKIESADQVKGLPTIGKSLKDHVCIVFFQCLVCHSATILQLLVLIKDMTSLCSDKDLCLFLLFKIVAKHHWMPYIVFITM